MECREFDNRAMPKVPARIRPALAVLAEALDYSAQTNSDRWEFAVEIDQLVALGLTRNDFRWLVRKQLVEHRREVTLELENGRVFAACGDLSFGDRTCFVLTEKARTMFRDERQANAGAIDSAVDDESRERTTTTGTPEEGGTPSGSNGEHAEALVTPRWDSAKRTLCVNGTLVKRFKWSAANQEAILAAFEEEGWPPRIDDPLSPQPEQDAKRRLSDTIKCLNRKQANPLLHFRGDGSGEGVVWERVDGHLDAMYAQLQFKPQTSISSMENHTL